jgi:hypothetical protein
MDADGVRWEPVSVVASDDPTAASPAQTGPTSPHTLGAELECDRLEHRARTLMFAIDVLHQRASAQRRESGRPPRHVRRAIADFEAQVEASNARLRDLAPERARRSSVADLAPDGRTIQALGHPMITLRRQEGNGHVR